jgi:hypothetical protein
MTAVLAAVMVAGPVAATVKQTSTQTGWQTIRNGTNEAWGGRGDFIGNWDRTYLCEEGTCYWHFSYIHMSVVMTPQEPSQQKCGFCTWTWVPTVNILNSSGTVLRSIAVPIDDACITQTFNPNQTFRTACKRNVDVPITASKVNFNWWMQALQSTVWHGNKTVAL